MEDDVTSLVQSSILWIDAAFSASTRTWGSICRRWWPRRYPMFSATPPPPSSCWRWLQLLLLMRPTGRRSVNKQNNNKRKHGLSSEQLFSYHTRLFWCHCLKRIAVFRPKQVFLKGLWRTCRELWNPCWTTGSNRREGRRCGNGE